MSYQNVNFVTGLTEKQEKYLLKHPAVGNIGGQTVIINRESADLVIEGGVNAFSNAVSTHQGRIGLAIIYACFSCCAIPIMVFTYSSCMAGANTCDDPDLAFPGCKTSQDCSRNLVWGIVGSILFSLFCYGCACCLALRNDKT